MRLLLVRHGLAGKADPDVYPDDDSRPLTPKGRKTFKRAAMGLRTLSPEPGRIFASPAERTLQTARLLAHGMRIGGENILSAPELHHTIPPARALAALSRKRLGAAVALVGHEPWLGRFLSLLVAGDERARFEFAKGGACLVDCASLGKGKGRLIWMLTEEQLSSFA